MKSFLLFLLFLFLLVITVTLQDLFLPVAFLGRVHLFLFPVIFCFAVLVLPFPFALSFGILTGLLEGTRVMQFHHDLVEIRLGWFIFFFMFWALLLQVLSDLSDGIRWELHALGSGLCTATLLLGEFFLLSCFRGGFSVSGGVFVSIFLPAGVAFFVAPCFYGVFQFLLPPSIQLPVKYPPPL